MAVTFLTEIRKELRNIETLRKTHETKAQQLKQKENRLRQLLTEFGSPALITVKRPMPEEQRRKISEAMKRRFAKN
ncbi:MAG: hypothetical protein JST77_02550 [Acidobacteria bacterium]|nr:hypothetical protein [Acidobacteriota bacterium]